MAAEVGTMSVAPKAAILTGPGPSPNQPPEGADNNWTKEISKKWKEMEKAVQLLANESHGAKYDPNLKRENVLENVHEIQKNSKEKHDTKWGKFRSILDDTLTVISEVGGMAAKAASIGFGPAEQCYNAINFVIIAWKGYVAAFETLSGILRDCAQFLQRLPSYAEGGLEGTLCRVTTTALDIFIQVCTRSLELRKSRSKRFKMFAQVAFLRKGDFKDLRDDMDNNTREELLGGVSEAHKHARRGAENSQATATFLQESAAEKQESKRQKQESEALMKVLDFGISPETWNYERDTPVETWKDIHTSIYNHRVEGTGDWLLTNDLFTAWVTDGRERLLAFVGVKGAGKSHLISAAISHLRTVDTLPLSSEGGKSRRLVAYHYIDNAQPNANIYNLGKSIIYQFTKDVSYKQTIAAICRDPRTHIESRNVMERLLLGIDAQLQKIDAVFYVVIHGLGSSRGNVSDPLMKFLKGIVAAPNSAIRVLFSTTHATIKKLQENRVTCATIQISKNNRSDREKYIAHRMDRMRMLSNTRELKVQEVRGKIQAKLCEKINDSYDRLKIELDEIDLLDTEDAIVKQLANVGKTMAQHVEVDIANLNKVRNPKELAEINEIILWLNYSKERMSPELTTAVLHVKNQGASLLSLHDQLKDKFRFFTIDDDGFVNFRAPDIAAKIKYRHALTKEQHNDEIVTQYEVNIINHFLANVCPSDLLKKLDLGEHFAQKMEVRGGEQICKEDKPTGNFLAAQACVTALVDGDPRLAVLRKYADRYLANHLSDTSPESIPPESLDQFGFDLASLFFDPDTIDNILRIGKPAPTLPPYLLESWSRTQVLRWIKHPTVVAKIRRERPDSWWRIEDDDNLQGLIEPFVRQMAAQCFLRRLLSPEATWRTFNQISEVCRMSKKCPHAVEQSRSPHPEEVEEWCQSVLRQHTLDNHWHTQMAHIFKEDKAIPKAIERCQLVLEGSPEYWQATLLLGQLVESPKEAIRMLEKLDERFKSDSQLQKDHVESFSDMAYFIGQRWWEQKMRAKATKWYTESVKRNPSAFERIYELITILAEGEEWYEILDLFDDMPGPYDVKLTPLVLEMSRYPTYHAFHTIILRALHQEYGVEEDILRVFYEDSIHTAKKQGDYRTSFYLQHFYANALSAIFPTPMLKVRDVLEDAASDLVRTDLDLARAFFLIGYRLGAIYLGDAKRAKSKEAAQRSLKKLVSIVPESLMESQMRLPLSLFAARYHHITGDEDTAKAEVRATLKIAIELLSDNDPTNDLFAYRKILYATIPFRAEKHANAALAMMKLETNFSMTCSCPCGEGWDTPEDMWICMDCIRVVLKPECKDRVTDPKKRNWVCHESHKHFEIGKWDKARMSNVPDNHVPYKDKNITMDQWREKLIRDFNLEEIHASKTTEAGKKVTGTLESGKAKLEKIDAGKKIAEKYEAGKSGVRNALRQ